MIEFPEAVVLSREINDALGGKTIHRVIAGQSPHKFAFFYKDPQHYDEFLRDKTITKAFNYGGFVRLDLNDNIVILFSEGIRIRYLLEGQQIPEKHQLLMEFTDHSCLVCSVQMYGSLLAFHDGDWENDYHNAARNKPSPLSKDFNLEYFNQLLSRCSDKLTLKGFLATEQRIPGLGNGVLQDILFNARLHPKKKITTLSKEDKTILFNSVKSTLKTMIEGNGRETEQDIFGYPGSYKTILCKNTVDKPCPTCGTLIQKQAYMGGSIYFCPVCQKM